MNKTAQKRLEILNFWERHGADAAVEAYQVSLRTLQRWARAREDAGGCPAALIPGSRAPKRRRRRNRPPKVVKKIRQRCRQHPNMGKQPLRVLPEPWRRRLRLPLPRIIAAAEDKMRITPARLDSRGRPKAVKKQRKERRPAGHAAEPLEVFAADTIVLVSDGVRRCLTTFIDPRSRFACCWASKRASSRCAAQALRTLLFLLYRPMRWVLTDNGSEFGKDFDNELKKHGIGRWRTYPPVAVVNARCERFNRTILERTSRTTTKTCCYGTTWTSSTAPWRNGWCSTTPNDPAAHRA